MMKGDGTMNKVRGMLVYLAMVSAALILAAVGCQSLQNGLSKGSGGESNTDALANTQKSVLKAEPGTPDGILLMQARYLIGELPPEDAR